MVNVEWKFIYHLPFIIHHLNFISLLIKNGDICPHFLFHLYALCSMLYALCSMLYALCSKLYCFLQLKAKTRPFIHLRKHCNLTAVCLDDVFYDGQAKASSAAEFGAAFVDSIKAFENTR